MLNNLPDNIIYKILYFLPNEDILKMKRINKNINESMNNSVFKQEVLYRDHPLVFNLLDNLCEYCNFKLIILSDCNKGFIFCNHC